MLPRQGARGQPRRPRPHPSASRTAAALGAMSGSRRSSSSRQPRAERDRRAHALQREVHRAGLRGGQPGPEEQLVRCRGPAGRAARSARPPRRGCPAPASSSPSFASVVGVVRGRAGGPARPAGRRGPRRAGRRVACHGSPAAGTTSIAADWRPRMSPPAPSAACSAASRRRASGPPRPAKAPRHRRPAPRARPSCWPGSVKPSPPASPANGDAALRRCARRRSPRASTTATWR